MIKIQNEIYNSVNEGFEIEIQIVDHCNLNCGGCNHFSCIAEENFISLKEYEKNIKKISTFKSLKHFMMVGGESLLHPDIPKLMEISRKYLDDSVKIDILTNGIILNNNLKFYLDLSNQYKINFLFTPYPYINYSNIEKYLNDNVNQYNIQILYGRMFFVQPNVSKEPKYNCKENYKNCYRYQKPTFIIRNSNVYVCPGSACMDIIAKKFDFEIKFTDKDYIKIDELDLEKLQNLFENGPESICSYCNPTDEHVYWHLYKDSLKNFNQFSLVTKKDFFLNNYSFYEEYFNGKTIFSYFQNNYFNKKTFLELIDPVYGHPFIDHELNRIEGKIDIIIPCFKTSSEQLLRLKFSLLSQTIIDDCHLYLISDSSPQEELLFDIFNDERLHCTFLKTPENIGPGGAKQLGINNSFNQYIFFIDCDDLLFSKNSLETLYNTFQLNPKVDMVCGKTFSIDILRKEVNIYNENWNEKYPKNMHGYCFKREFLNEKKIKFENYYLSEDADMYFQIVASEGTISFIDEYIYLYIRGNSTSFGPNTNWIQKALSFLIVHMNGLKKLLSTKTFDSKNNIINILVSLFNIESTLQGQGIYDENEYQIVFNCYLSALNFIIKNLEDKLKDDFNINLKELLENNSVQNGFWLYSQIKNLDNLNFTNFVYNNYNNHFFKNTLNNIYWI